MASAEFLSRLQTVIKAQDVQTTQRELPSSSSACLLRCHNIYPNQVQQSHLLDPMRFGSQISCHQISSLIQVIKLDVSRDVTWASPHAGSRCASNYVEYNRRPAREREEEEVCRGPWGCRCSVLGRASLIGQGNSTGLTGLRYPTSLAPRPPALTSGYSAATVWKVSRHSEGAHIGAQE